jgi:acyl carrier protein
MEQTKTQTENRTISRIKEIFAGEIGEGIVPEKINEEQVIEDMEYVDSLTMLKILTQIEKEFKVIFQIETLDHDFYNIKNIAEYISKKQ